MLDVMLDLETMGNSPQAAIVAIGAVEFDLAQNATGERFYAVVDLHTSVAAGGVMDASTVLWWLRQSIEAREAFANGGRSIDAVLHRFSEWLHERGGLKDIRIWGNGADFDNAILSSAYTRLNLVTPWSYWNNRCYRTIKAMHGSVKITRTGTYHNAVDDAQSQAEHLISMMGG